MRYIIDHIPKSTPNNRRPALAMNPTTITMHNTGNPTSTARNERAWLTNPTNDRTASFHIAVDEREAIEVLPLNENAWHAGDGSGVNSGNRTSIGIEICESGNYAKTIENAAELVAKMLRERGWGVDRLRRHYDWSRKICPRLMYDGGSWTGWNTFKSSVQAKLKEADGLRQITVSNAIIIGENGSKYEGFVHNGTTFAPVRQIAESVGYKVGWNQADKTVTLSKGAK